jgi:cell division transport system ATP-binding protein
MSAIQLKQVSKSYVTHQRSVGVLDRVNLELKTGDFLYVLGGSGAGKSSLLRMIATEEDPTQGELFLFGYSLQRASPTTLRAIRQALGYVPQDVRLIPDLSVSENVALSLTLAGKRALTAQLRGQVDELLERLGLTPRRNQLAGILSGGEAQRVAVARALIRKPELLIADEPTGAQDRDFTWSLMDLFLKANIGGATVLVATHDREIVRRVRKNCVVLHGGKVTLEETVCTY